MSFPRNILFLSGTACGAVLALLIYVAIMSAPMDADTPAPITPIDLADATGGAK
jgi:hypothetical protein